jgi:hypothetical protein
VKLEKNMLRKLILLSAPLLLAIPASADLISFIVDPSTIQTAPGGIYNPSCQTLSTQDCVIFSGSISFTTDQDYSLNDIAIVMSLTNPDGGADVVGNDNYFQLNSPGILGTDGVQCGIDDSCYTGGLFEIDVAPDTPLGVYTGTATLVATDEPGDPIIGPDTVQSFEVDVIAPIVPPTPEPDMAVLMFAGLAALVAVGSRHRRKENR